MWMKEQKYTYSELTAEFPHLPFALLMAFLSNNDFLKILWKEKHKK